MGEWNQTYFKRIKIWRNFLAVFLFAIAVAAVTACSKKEQKKEAGQTQDTYLYQSDFREFAVDVEDISAVCRKDDWVYMIGSKWVEDKKKKDSGRVCYYLLHCAMDGSDAEQIQLKELGEEETILFLILDDQNQFRLLTRRYQDDQENQNRRTDYCFYTMNEKGKIKRTVEINLEKADVDQDNDLLNTSSDNAVFFKDHIYIAGGHAIYTFGMDGKAANVYEGESRIYYGRILPLNGKLYVYEIQNQDDRMREFDPETGNFGETIKINQYKFYSGLSFCAAEGDSFYINDGNYLYTLNVSSGSMKTKFPWLNSGVNPQRLVGYFPMGEHNIFAVSLFYDEQTERHMVEFANVNRVRASEVQNKEIIKLACTGIDNELKEKILFFNKHNKKYQIQVKDYSIYKDKLKRLNLDIASSQIPDIVDLSSGIVKEAFIEKGMFTDLYPLMEKDQEVTKGDFIPSVLKTLEIDGKLYYMAPSFQIDGFAVGKNMAGDMEGWSIDDMEKLYKEVKEGSIFMQGMTRRNFVGAMMQYQLDDFIDWDSGEVSFDSDAFIKLLKFSNHFADEVSDMAPNDLPKFIKEGKLILSDLTLYNMEDIEIYTNLYKDLGGYTILSYPSSDKNNKLPISLNGCSLAITEKCSHKQGAWEFVRQFLTYDYESNLDIFPTRQDVLDKKLEYVKAVKAYTDEDGTKVKPVDSIIAWGDYKMKLKRPVNDEEETLIRDMIGRIGICLSYSTREEDIVEIITEEIEAFFAGDKTAEEIAEIIQGRVKMYVSEHL